MARDESSERSLRCIRCDDEVDGPARPSKGNDYVLLAFNQETGFLPICNACFEEVRDRDLTQR